mgnify:CR=1 FL=1
MAHQCVRCNTFYDDGSRELLNGCSKCSGKFFFYVKNESRVEAERIVSKLSDEDKREMEMDAIDIIGSEFDTDKPIVLDLENIKILKPGKFELDLVELFKGTPLVYKLEDGKYFIDVPSTFEAKEFKLFKGKKAPLEKEGRKSLDLDDKETE